jgi:DegV family protein with EDD domain
MPVKVVTDSTADIPAEIAKSLGITVVPLIVTFGSEMFKDGVDLTHDEFYQRLIDGPVLPTTSQPAPGDFVQVYDELGKDADGILSLHISSKISGTYNSAVQGKTLSATKCPIEVVDTYQASMAEGMIVMAAARAASQGATLEEAAEIARATMPRAQCCNMLDTLEYLKKGGRIGKAQALLGTILKIKPMIMLRDGEVHEHGKVRTLAKGVARLQEVARGYAPVEELCVLYSTNADLAQDVAQNLRDLFPGGKEPLIARFGPVIGTYVGPGAVGIALIQAEGAQITTE